MALFYQFKEKKFAAMVTTNLSARGLDFPKVDWVIQMDAPDDYTNYIHRIGRTARYKSDGKSLLLVLSSED